MGRKKRGDWKEERETEGSSREKKGRKQKKRERKDVD